MLKTTKTLPFQLKSACKANGIGGRLVGRGRGGEGKNQTPSNQKGLQDQKASLMKLPKKKDHVRVECMPTYKKVLHAGVQALHSKAHSRHCHPLLHLILGTLTYCQLSLHQHDNFFFKQQNKLSLWNMSGHSPGSRDQTEIKKGKVCLHSKAC